MNRAKVTMNVEAERAAVPAIVVMGVSGSGKSTMASRLATDLGWDFLEGDVLHPSANVEAMAMGTPLTDADRWPWLDAIAAWITGQRRDGQPAVVACSALRRVYRDRLRAASPGVRFVYLCVSHDKLAARMAQRRHFMPPSLLDSQLATLQEPDADEAALRVAAGGSVKDTLAHIRRWLAAGGATEVGVVQSDGLNRPR